MSIDFGATATGKLLTQPIAASDGLLSAFVGGTTTIADMTVLIMGRVPPGPTPFGTGNFCECVSIQDGSGNEGFRFRYGPAGEVLNLRFQNNLGTSKALDITLPDSTNGSALYDKRFTLGAKIASLTPSSRIVYGTGAGTSVNGATATAFVSGQAIRQAVNVYIGNHSGGSNRCWPGHLALVAVLSTALSDAAIDAIHAANDPGWVLHTYRTSILWATCYGLLADVVGATTPMPGQSVANDSLIVYNSGTQTSWYGVAPSAPTVAGTITYSRPRDLGYVVNTSIVPDGGQDMREVQNRAKNPALAALGRRTYTRPTHIKFSGNSNAVRSNSDVEHRQTANDTYNAAQLARRGSRWDEGLHIDDAFQCVGVSRLPTLAGSATSNADWIGAIPSSGSVAFRTGSTSNRADCNFSQVSMGNETAYNAGSNTGYGPGAYLQVPATAGVIFLATNHDAVLPSTRLRLWLLVDEYPGCGSATLRGCSLGSGSATEPFGDAATNYANATLHGSDQTTVLDNKTATISAGVSAASGATLTLTADPGLRTGDVVVVNRGGTECLGNVSDPALSPAIDMEFPMGSGTAVPTAGDDVYIGSYVGFRWLSIEIGEVSPSANRGVRLVAGSGLPVHVRRFMWQALDGVETPRDGLLTHNEGQGGSGYGHQITRMPSLANADDGLTPLERWQAAWLPMMRWKGGICSNVVTCAQQSSVAADADTMVDAMLAAGFRPSEIGFCSDTPSANNTSAFSTQAYQDFSARGLVLGPAAGIVAINPFVAMGVPFSQLINGELADTAHLGAEGTRIAASHIVRILSPVADGGGGAALAASGGARGRARGRTRRSMARRN